MTKEGESDMSEMAPNATIDVVIKQDQSVAFMERSMA